MDIIASRPVVCEMFRDGYGCSGESKVLLVVNPDKTVSVLCEECVELNKDKLQCGTMIFRIGDDITGHFL